MSYHITFILMTSILMVNTNNKKCIEIALVWEMGHIGVSTLSCLKI